ncbi:hypothetical protein DEIPH_ctg036orf0009 [Deinococcus phoenicis]|uniref:Uncharacterized protein n=1 Tax=Deinococcus phoenicis TaxID=1476583 RepID=A0A016QP96_9DEIO|nr:hypothetical protein [Deinococcus phoenicis]EYB67559.1 hypothetical protein DEIPH_ctg036orf0009 [Deinococcus phoenicis]
MFPLWLLLAWSGVAVGAAAWTPAQRQAYAVAAQNILRTCVETLEQRRSAWPSDQPPGDWDGQSCVTLVPGLSEVAPDGVQSVVRLHPETLEGYAVTVTTAQGDRVTWPTPPTPRPARAGELGLILATDAAGWFARLLGVLVTGGVGWLCAFWASFRKVAWLGWLGMLGSLGLPAFLLLAGQGGADLVFPPELVWWPLVALLGAGCFTLPRSLHSGAAEPLWQRLGVGLLAMVMLALFGLLTAAKVEQSSFGVQFGATVLMAVPVAALLMSVAVLRNRRNAPG